MEKRLFIWQIVGITFTAVTGTLLHFLYQWTKWRIFAPVSAVNESTWEHMKLAFVPSLLFAVTQSFFAEEYGNFWLVKLIGISVGTALIPVIFYTLRGSFGEVSTVIDITIFFVAVICEYLLEFYLFGIIECNLYQKLISLSLLLLGVVAFTLFTFYPPQIPLFLDPVTNGYGIT